MAFLQTVWLMTRKDLLIEARSREILFTTLFFAVSCVLVFAFGFVRAGKPVQDAAGSRDVLLPVLLYPITIPVIIAGVRGTAALLQVEVDLPMARAWLSMLTFFDVMFITLALWTFAPV